MMATRALFLCIALFALGCSTPQGAPPETSCEIPVAVSCISNPPRLCSEYPSENVFCTTQVTYESACPKESRVGSCRVHRESGDFVVRYYPDYTRAQAEKHCEGMNGYFCR